MIFFRKVTQKMTLRDREIEEPAQDLRSSAPGRTTTSRSARRTPRLHGQAGTARGQRHRHAARRLAARSQAGARVRKGVGRGQPTRRRLPPGTDLGRDRGGASLGRRARAAQAGDRAVRRLDGRAAVADPDLADPLRHRLQRLAPRTHAAGGEAAARRGSRHAGGRCCQVRVEPGAVSAVSHRPT